MHVGSRTDPQFYDRDDAVYVMALVYSYSKHEMDSGGTFTAHGKKQVCP